jgi:hypothetical protein
MEAFGGGGGGHISSDPFRGAVAASNHGEGSRRRVHQAGGVDGHLPGDPFEGAVATSNHGKGSRRCVHQAGSVDGHLRGELAGYAEGPRCRGVAAGRAHLVGGVEEGHISWAQDDAPPGSRAAPLLAQGRSGSSVRPSPTSVVCCLRPPPTFPPWVPLCPPLK